MRLGPSFRVAWRLLRGREKASGGLAGAIVGIGISLVPLVLVMMVSDGMIQGITSRYIETKTYHIQAALPPGLGDEELEKGRAALESLPLGLSVFHETNGSAVAVSGKSSHAVVLRAIDEEFFDDPGTRGCLSLVEGSMGPEGKRDIVLGSALAEVLGLGLGDSVTIITPSPSDGAGPGGYSYMGADFSPRLSFFRVGGIVSAGYRDLDALWAFIRPETARTLLTYPSVASFFGVKTSAPYSPGIAGERSEAAAALASAYPQWMEDSYVRPWPDIEKNLYRSFGTTKTLLMFIMAIALMVAAVNLGSALSTFVAERSMDIAVLRSFGASGGDISAIFLSAGLLAGGAGTLAGIAAGAAVSAGVNGIISAFEWIINLADSAIGAIAGRPAAPLRLLDPAYYLERIPVPLDLGQLSLLALLSVSLCAVASLVPARRAARVPVQDLIRKN